MEKEYSIRVPLHTTSIQYLSEINRRKNISISVYGGVPDSPLNGGRFNSVLNGIVLHDRFFLGVNKNQLDRAMASFYNIMTQANQHNLPFFIALTNMFVTEEELTEENLYPVQRLVESSEKYGVKNGLILTNPLLENYLRQKYGDRLLYSASCTKYTSAQKRLTPKETLGMYLADSGKYDYICLTTQDSRRERLIRTVVSENKSKTAIFVIPNSYCALTCDSYQHYKDISLKNKKSVLKIGSLEMVADALTFMLPRLTTCPALRHSFHKPNITKITEMQLNAGIVNFKLGRSRGAAIALDQIVAVIEKARKNRP